MKRTSLQRKAATRRASFYQRPAERLSTLAIEDTKQHIRFSRLHVQLLHSLLGVKLLLIVVGALLSLRYASFIPVSLTTGLAVGMSRLGRNISSGQSMLISSLSN